MKPPEYLASYPLSAGVEGILSDMTSHYFGGYFHVRLQLHADVPVTAESFANIPEYEDALKRLGTSVRFCRILEKMAVPENMIAAVRTDLVASFDANELPYLMRDNFMGSFVRSTYRKTLKSTTPVFR